ncbi:MAG: hypothetical protein VX936_14485 [Planctomycetota bacterium]|nr:hypothetical protein [Planctomycetota bacterium]
MKTQKLFLVCLLALGLGSRSGQAQEMVGLTVTPHLFSSEMRWRRPPEQTLSARVEMFLQNQGEESLILTDELRFDGKTPEELLQEGMWAWHDMPGRWPDKRLELKTGELTVLAWNGRSEAWGATTGHQWDSGDGKTHDFVLSSPSIWISGVRFLGSVSNDSAKDSLSPNRVLIHVDNRGSQTFSLKDVQIWLPPEGSGTRRFVETEVTRHMTMLPEEGVLGANETAIIHVECEPLPLGYAVIQVVGSDAAGNPQSLWSCLRVKKEVFDISGGWVASKLGDKNSLTEESYLKTLGRMHINTGQIQDVAGYTDQPELYAKYPLKRFNRLQPIEAYDRDEILPTIHAVEFLGEPQYGGGKPVPPQDVHDALAPYRSSRMATSVTLSEERTWRYYAGLSDYPHYDAYRVIAPAADHWSGYDRWGEKNIRWGAPLETIGVMTRSLRHHSRPRSIAYWSQGAHHDWGSWRNPRRGSPTPDELRSQAWHGLGNGVTSLYWFNLSLKSLLKFPDLIEPITRVNREVRMLEDLLLESQLYDYRCVEAENGKQWDLTLLVGARASMVVIHDLDYQANREKREFVFAPRLARVDVKLPSWLANEADIFRIDADGVHEVKTRKMGRQLHLEDEVNVVGIYVVSSDPQMRAELTQSHAELISREEAFGFDPASNPEDLDRLRALLPPN